jgi:hypothetical protein
VFFLRGVAAVATEANASVVKILELRERYHRVLAKEGGKATGTLLRLFTELTGFKRNRRFSFGPYLDLFSSTSPVPEEAAPKSEAKQLVTQSNPSPPKAGD